MIYSIYIVDENIYILSNVFIKLILKGVNLMKIRIVLNGDLKSCCSSYPASKILEIMKGWFMDDDEVEVIDRTKTVWAGDEISNLAENYFGEKIYPLTYVNNFLVALGQILDRESILEISKDAVKYAISKEDLIKASRKNVTD